MTDEAREVRGAGARRMKSLPAEISTLKVEVHAEAEPIPIDLLSDDELKACVAEAQKRGLLNGEKFDRDYAEEAYNELRGNRLSTGLCLLERCLFGDRKLVERERAG